MLVLRAPQIARVSAHARWPQIALYIGPVDAVQLLTRLDVLVCGSSVMDAVSRLQRASLEQGTGSYNTAAAGGAEL
jgi:hypothetical protein